MNISFDWKAMDIAKFFKRLDDARKKRGHSIREACEEIGISRPTWYVWADGKITGRKGIGELQQKAAEAYIAKTK